MTQSANKELARLKEAAAYLRKRIVETPQIALILGSGLSEALGSLDDEKRFSWADIPNFPKPTVEGHIGEWLFGRLEVAGPQPQKILIQRGRVHYYEGYSMREIVFPVRVMKLLGVEKLIITNAAGAINEQFKVGDFVLIRDHINMIPDNPLRGENLSIGPRFPDLSEAYSASLRELAKQAAEKEKIALKEGVYVATPGPMFETPAEIQAYKRMGADLVGMSTVPEVIAARHCGIEILGISVVTNMAAGIKPGARLTHEEVLEVTKRREKDLSKLLQAILKELTD